MQVEELIDYAIFMIDVDGTIVSWNAGVGTVLGYQREDFIGQPFAMIFTPEDRANGEHRTESLTAKCEGRSSDMRWHLRKDGSRVYIDGALNAIREEDGRLIGFSKVMKDATAQHEAEDALRKSEEQLQRSNKELAEFAHVVSHDLQAPLRTIRSYVQLLAKRYQGRLDQTADEFISFILEGSEKMDELIRGLLHYAEFGQDGELVSVPLDEVIEAVSTTLKTVIEETEAEISCGELPTVRANPIQIQQVFQNLIGNALKYKSAVRPRIRIECMRDDGNWICSVADNGIGIAAEYYDRIFLPLKRLHGDEIAGTGLGLAVCKKIVERSGGRISVESKVGEGSKFRFTLPVA